MRSPVFWRRSSTAAGVYLSAALGFLGSVVAFRELGTYDFGLLALVLAAFLVVSMALRLAALAAGAAFGVVETVVALLAAQVLATGAIAAAALVVLRRFPAHEPTPLGEDRLPFRRFVIQSSLGSVLSPMRGLLGTLLLGAVTGPKQVSYLRIGQTPESAFASLSSPVRLILLTEQTHHVEQGRSDRAYRMLRRYVTGATALMALIVPPLLWLMPHLLRIAYGAKAGPATNAARIILLVAAIQVIWGWAKSFPVSIGRPGLRLFAQGTEIAVLIPSLLVLGALYGATGAAGGFLIAACAFAGVWTVLLVRLRREPRAAREPAPAVSP